jgi:hypothetical protein
MATHVQDVKVAVAALLAVKFVSFATIMFVRSIIKMLAVL